MRNRGVIVYCNIAQDSGEGYGFIEPIWVTNNRAANVYFGSAAANKVCFARGDLVEWEDGTPHEGRGPRASKVWLSNEGKRK